MISVMILTKNEEQDLPDCLASVGWSDDVHVFDSYSTDCTVKLARTFGANVMLRPFDDYASQRNAALQRLPFKHEWVLILDADERIPEELSAEMLRFVRSRPASASAGRMRRRDFLGRTWLKHSQISPYYIRLVRPGKAHYERKVNEVLKVDGPIHDFENAFDHYPFSKGMQHWLGKHNVYSSMEARCALDSRSGATPFSMAKAFTASDFNERRFHQKELFYRLPLRPWIKFVYVYFWRRGFLDGRAGLTYACLQAIYEYFIVLKTRELEAQRAS